MSLQLSVVPPAWINNMSNYMVHHIKRMLYLYSENLGTGAITVFATLLLFTTAGLSQEVSGTTQKGTPQVAVTSTETVGNAATKPPVKVRPSKSSLGLFTKTKNVGAAPTPQHQVIQTTGNLRSGHISGSLGFTADFESITLRPKLVRILRAS